VIPRGAPLLLLLLAATASVGCQGGRANPSTGPGPSARGPVSSAQGLPSGWGRLKPLLDQGEALSARGDEAALMALVPRLKEEGLSLLKANMPSTLARHDVPRFLEGRASFGDALVRLAAAQEEGRAAELPALVRSVADAWRGWMSVLTGQSPERAV